MPYKSDAQRRFMHSKSSPLTKKEQEHWDKESKGKHIPEKVSKKK